MTAPDARPVFTLTIQSVPRHDVPADVRLRRLLKGMLRGYGFRLLSITQAPAKGEQPAPPAPSAATTRQRGT